LERPQDASPDVFAKDLLPQLGADQEPEDLGALQRFLQTQLQLALRLVPHLFEQMPQMVRMRLPAILPMQSSL
jgi:hypothetical protein